MTIDHMLSIGFPLIIFFVGSTYLFHGVRAILAGQFTRKSFQVTKAENPSKFLWIVWGRIFSAFILIVVSIGLAYVFRHS